MKEENTETVDDVEAVHHMRTDTEEKMNGDEEVGLHITNGTGVVIISTQTDTAKIRVENVEVALRDTEIMKNQTVYLTGEKETDTEKITVKDAEVTLLVTETIAITTIDTEIDAMEKAEIEKTTTMMDAEEVMKGKSVEVPPRSLREDAGVPPRRLREGTGVRHLPVAGKVIDPKAVGALKSTRRSTNNRNKTETDERANMVRKIKF